MTKHYVDDNGLYLGAFDGCNPAVSHVEVSGPPTHACMIWNGSSWQQPDKNIEDVKEEIWLFNKSLLLGGVVFDGYRHCGSGGHREYIATQYNLIKAGSASQYGSILRDSDGNDQVMNDAKLCALYENGADYVSKINQAAMAAEDSLQAMTQEQLNSFDPEADIVWPSNIYTYP